MVKSRPELISPGEADLVNAIQQVRHGELYGVEVDLNGGRWVEVDLAPPMRELILYIRSGVQSIDILTVHNGQPITAETDCMINGFRCRKKTRFQ